ncbi:MAG: hypothetical protein K6E50_15180, partial [Lachnospiraceae bacterium]|nr:hypothetical protein [Lachnospiraceae bacterium]
MKKSTNQRRKLNRLLSFILSLSMILSCMEGLSLRAWAEGETVEAEDPIAEDPGVEEPDGADYVEWTATDSLPTEAGSYKLMNDVTLSTALWLRPAETGLMFVYDIDLNGKTITLEGDGKFNVGGETVSLRLKNGTIRSLGGKKEGAFILTANSNFKSGNVIADKVKFSGGVTTSRYQAICLSKCAYACSITDCSFSGFRYAQGAAIYIQDTEMSISGTRFINNKGSRGGAIYAEGNKELNISDCTFESNESGYGGAIYSDNAKVIVTKTEMKYNKAENQGGAIFACGNVLDISDSKIHWNSVTGADSDQKSGAAIYCVE